MIDRRSMLSAIVATALLPPSITMTSPAAACGESRGVSPAVRLAVIGGQLRQKLVVGDARRSVEAGFGLDLLANSQRDVPGERDTLQIFRRVQVCLVERQRLDDRRVLGEDLSDLLRDCE
jgi:hypothetical protein